MTFIRQLLITSLTQSSPANHRSISVIDSAFMFSNQHKVIDPNQHFGEIERLKIIETDTKTKHFLSLLTFIIYFENVIYLNESPRRKKSFS
jgi:hypothetical protein